MKRRVKWISQSKNGKKYKQPWIGYSYRNKNGVSDFCREVSLKGLSQVEVDRIDFALRNGTAINDATGDVQFLDSLEFGGYWSAYCISEKLGIVDELSRFDEKHKFSILSMILDRIIQPLPHSKLSLWESLPGSSIERVVAPGGMHLELHDIYKSLEKLHGAQKEIQQKLYDKHQVIDNMYLYDITSSYFEGNSCELAKYGYNRDGKKGKMQIVIGLLTNSEGRPLSIEVFEGNTSDQTTVMDKIDNMRKDFGINEMIFIGDRGMITKARREDLQGKEYESVKYISALRRKEFLDFLEEQNHPLQLTLFDRKNLVEVSHEGIRYVLSFNPEKEIEDRETRLRLIEKTEEKLKMIQRNVKNGRLKKEQAISKKLYRWVNKWNMERFFVVNYKEGEFSFTKNEAKIKEYEAIDGFYVITSNVVKENLNTKELRGRYKSLIQVEQAFRTMKTTDIFIRPIRHWNSERVKGHVFLCMLSYLVIWEARRLFDEFISKDSIDETTKQEEIHSLRTVWERLNRDVKIGKLKINGKVEEQIKPMKQKTKQMLKVANASFTKKRMEQLMIVG